MHIDIHNMYSQRKKFGNKSLICGSGGSKSRLAAVGGAEPAHQMKDEKSRCGAKQILKS